MAGIGHRGFMGRKKEPVGLPFIFSVTVGSGQSFQLPTVITGTYDAIIDWGDGGSDVLTVWDSSSRNHTYASAGTYDISISGVFNGWSVNNYSDRLKITEVKQWGILQNWYYLGFWGCTNIVFSATDIPIIGVGSMGWCFRNCTGMSSIPNINQWDVSGITSFCRPDATQENSGTFYNSSFNDYIGDWDVSNAVGFTGMFGNTPFNQDISSWNVSAGIYFSYMFRSSSFNQDISSWNVSAGIYFSYMFRSSSFNQDISSWNVAESRAFLGMFQANSAFSQDLSSWPVTSHGDDSSQKFRAMFANAVSVNFSPASWDVESMVDATNMFNNVTLSTSNYDATLISWANQQVQNGVTVNFGTSKYTAGGAAEAARTTLISTYGWAITDGGAA